MNKEKYPHYYKKVTSEYIDVYRVLQLFEVTDPCIQHAIKKLLVAGSRGIKGIDKDIQEAIVSLERWKEMRDEELNDSTQIAKNFNTPEIPIEYANQTYDKKYSPYLSGLCDTGAISGTLDSAYDI